MKPWHSYSLMKCRHLTLPITMNNPQASSVNMKIDHVVQPRSPVIMVQMRAR